MKRLIFIVGFVAWFLVGCYDDKGNYDYKEINTIDGLMFMPTPIVVEEGNSYRYEYRQPAQEELKVTYSPVFTQSMVEGEDNVEYLWTVAYKEGSENVVDSVFTKELELAYSPKQATKYNVKFRLSDKRTGVDHYRDFIMTTKVPFVNSWFILNGPENDRKLSTVEEPDSTNPIISYDAYKDLWNRERFQKAEALSYVNFLTLSDGMDKCESLYVVQRDSVALMLPFVLEDRKDSRSLFAPGANPSNLVYSESHPMSRYAIAVDNNGKFYHSGGSGYYFTGLTEADVQNYVIDKIYMSRSGFTTIWDKMNRKFMSFNPAENRCYDIPSPDGSYPQNAVESNTVEISDFPVEGLSEEVDGVTHLMEILWLGQGITSGSEETGATAIGVMADTSYVFYIEASDKEKSMRADESPIKVKRVNLGELGFDQNTCFATSSAYAEQFFYTKESKVFLFNTVSKESIELYDAGDVITKLKFRSDVDASFPDNSSPYRCLGIVVNAAGAGELHEVILDEAGDFVTSHTFTGFGEIKDLIYTTVMRVIQ